MLPLEFEILSEIRFPAPEAGWHTAEGRQQVSGECSGPQGPWAKEMGHMAYPQRDKPPVSLRVNFG